MMLIAPIEITMKVNRSKSLERDDNSEGRDAGYYMLLWEDKLYIFR